MSRLYDNKPLHNLPVKTINWSKEWNPSHYKRASCLYESLSGNGVLLEGTMLGRSRFAITDREKNKFRYIVFHTSILRAHQRKFDGSGKEIEPNFSETMKISTGFLNSSYKVAPKGETDAISLSQVISLVCKDELDALTVMSQPMVQGNNSIISFWIEENSIDKIEIQDGDIMRIRTAGDSPFIESFSKLETGAEPLMVGNYSGGDQVGDCWTDKIMKLKLSDSVESEGGAVGSQGGSSCMSEGMAADDDEWDD